MSVSELQPVAGQLPADVPVRQSSAQGRLWFLHQSSDEVWQHNVLCRFRLTAEPLCAKQLEQAVISVMQRHSVLRSCYSNGAEGPQQWYSATGKPEMFEHDWSDYDSAGQAAQLQALIHQEQTWRFDLENGPLARVHLLRYGSSQELIVNLHHIVFDGRSGEILLTDLATAYAAGGALPELPLQYTDFAVWEGQLAEQQAYADKLEFWREYLRGMPVRLEYTRRSRDASGAAQLQLRIEAAELQQLRAAARQQKLPMFTLLTGLFNVWFSYLSGQQRFLLGTDYHGRDVADFMDVVGFFVNQLVIKTELDETTSLQQLLKDTRSNIKLALANRQIPFDVLVGKLLPRRDTDVSPFFQVKLNYQPNRCPITAIGDASLTGVEIMQHLAGFDLVMDVVDGKDLLLIYLEYNSGLFSNGEMQQFLHLWQRLLGSFDQLLSADLTSLKRQLQQWQQEQQQQLQQASRSAGRAGLQKRSRRLAGRSQV